ncbi:uncharacterized protein LOC129570670 [Sitodiplosis mosellana]|uniref:uncharacterized protein LOC129570670 n=1 Tax=Sitodiplosis mosellana TaxID=263140 RepID=UPI0024437B9C|nr:uncharacterized protein LOC129570670 [Sitodiplosis mosellana]
MSIRKKTASKKDVKAVKRQQEVYNKRASKRFKKSMAVSTPVKTNERSSGKKIDQPKKVYNTRLRCRMKEEMKLTDVNVDCLENIFKRMRFTDLLSVAESNKQLKPGADLAFKSRYGRRSIEIDLESKSIYFYNMKGRRTTKIRWSLRFKLLRCFGHLMSKLKIAYVRSRDPSPEDSKRAAHIDRYINKYCAKSMMEIKFEHCEARTLQDLKKPFAAVESVRFVGCELGSKWSELSKWFPKVRYLDFSCENELSNRKKAAHFPDLQELNLYIPRDRKKHFASLLRLNPNLRTLSISGYFDAKYLQNASEHLQHLKVHSYRDIVNSSNTTIHCPNMKELTLQNIAPERFPLTFDQLTELIITPIANNYNYVDLIISKQMSLSKLTYWGSKLGEQGSLLKIASTSLIEVNLFYCRFQIDEVVTFMDKCTALTKFTLGFDNENDHRVVLSQSSGPWRRTSMKRLNGVMIVTMER